MRTVIPGDQAASGRPFSGATIANGLVFVSGQTFVEGMDVEAQTHGSLDKIEQLLSEAGTNLASAMRCTVYLSDLDLYDRLNAAYGERFPVDPPARVVVGASLGSGCLVEIDCIAVIPEGS